jgi:16S rRNA (cytidine1402-2'-O)-methyltransferase
MSVEEHVRHYLVEGLRKNDAIKAAARDRGVAKNDIYQQVLDVN